MNKPLMPKATAVWLIDNTSLTFKQIAEFCDMHPLEIKGIADGEVAIGVMGLSPVVNGELTDTEINLCQQDPNRSLRINSVVNKVLKSKKQTKYTPIARRQDKPNAIAWFVKNYPEAKDAHIVRLIGTTKNTIEAIKSRTHWNIQNIKPKDPVLLGLCSQTELDKIITKINFSRQDHGEK